MIEAARLIRGDSPEWPGYLGSCRHDFFHTAEYHLFSEAVGEGEAWLAVYGNHERFVAWPYLLRPIEGTRFSDATSVYGYAGPLVHGCGPGDALLERARKALVELWKSQGIVSVFARLHPLLGNHAWLEEGAGEAGGTPALRTRGRTVSINLMKPAEETWQDYHRTLRRSVLRGREAGLGTEPDPAWDRIGEFILLYQQTMRRNRAASFYFFSADYFHGLKRALGPHGMLMATYLGEQMASAVLAIEYQGIVTAHLAASDEALLDLSPTKTLLHELHLWARGRGNRYFHLGGGRGSRDDDPLFRFKAQFSKDSHSFYTLNWILDPGAYSSLVEQHRKAGSGEIDPDYFPAYRGPVQELSSRGRDA